MRPLHLPVPDQPSSRVREEELAKERRRGRQTVRESGVTFMRNRLCGLLRPTEFLFRKELT
jgi:hypothetical protein